MIKIAYPLADTELSERILELTKKLHDEKKLISGIKACQKKIQSKDANGLMVFNASISPMDLITHMPILCENNQIAYVFVEDSTKLNGFTCVFFNQSVEVDDLIEKVKKLK